VRQKVTNLHIAAVLLSESGNSRRLVGYLLNLMIAHEQDSEPVPLRQSPGKVLPINARSFMILMICLGKLLFERVAKPKRGAAIKTP
jgi:hypothetical protein